MNVRIVVSLRSLAFSHSFLAHTSLGSRCPSVCLISISSPSSSLSHSSSILSSSCYPSTSPRLSSKIPCVTSPRRWGQLTSSSPTHSMAAKVIAELLLARGYINYRGTNVEPVNVCMSCVQRWIALARTHAIWAWDLSNVWRPTLVPLGFLLVNVTRAPPQLARRLE